MIYMPAIYVGIGAIIGAILHEIVMRIQDYYYDRDKTNDTNHIECQTGYNLHNDKNHRYLQTGWTKDKRLHWGGYATGCCIYCKHLIRYHCDEDVVVDWTKSGVDAKLFDEALEWGGNNSKSFLKQSKKEKA